MSFKRKRKNKLDSLKNLFLSHLDRRHPKEFKMLSLLKELFRNSATRKNWTEGGSKNRSFSHQEP